MNDEGRSAAIAVPSTPERSANERAILNMLRQDGPTPAAEIARRMGLSAQSASVITRKLEAEGLVLRGSPVRGKIGKPSTPIQLDPAGAFAIGLRIGRRRSDLILIDLEGRVLGQKTATYAYPTPASCLDLARAGLAEFKQMLSADQHERIAGIGIGMPFDLWNWLDLLGAPRAEMQAWHDFPAQDAFAEATGLPAFVGNDGSLACHGEHLFGGARHLPDFGYIFVGAFLGGGIVLDGRLYLGAGGNAGALASLPVPGADGRMTQMLEVASIHQLERRLEARMPGNGQRLLQQPAWAGFDDLEATWIEETARQLASATVTLVAVLDLPSVVIDGSFPAEVRQKLIARVETLVAQVDTRGIRRPQIVSGTLGITACALGAGYRPIVARYLVE
ncbi:Sugar kinase of the NBD/HSP70 family, may contain an N-terminal HTH domain [Palleronia marisminoris]|uniref:N-acetylglucosamine repressor n=2 Tax=Palleronia marisminoris TaxID=315423 RepID=A0A1Y5RLX0_9RHOB|nr:ROK family transcriptional regulator [Palleronia marisminoris]SFG26648.1 Sugar kinase of the NBD/HSP70 family, may contain an N-terminal HTH domain [Palleronia marisminoris]SLN20392.1 N-acetylglucosamine repressor [Palleronia marisminoris]